MDNAVEKNSVQTEGQRVWQSQKKHAERHNAWKRARSSSDIGQDERLRLQHGITLDFYRVTLTDQMDGCAICGTMSPGTRGGVFFEVDHDHSHCPDRRSCQTCFRGIVCHRCNTYVIPVFEGRRVGMIDAEYLFVRAYMEDYLLRRAYLEAEVA